MVEALVVIPFFIILFVSIVFIGNLYDAKLRVMRLAKEGAWSYAMANCGEAGDPLTSSQASGSEAPQAYGGEPDTAHDFSDYSDQGESANEGQDDASTYGGKDGQLASKGFGSSIATLSESVSVGADGGGFAKVVSTRTKVMCNEVPIDGGFVDLMKAGWHALTSW